MTDLGISIVLPVHNKAFMIQRVLQSIWDMSSELVNEVIIILDGCTDKSEELVCGFVTDKCPSDRIFWNVLRAPDVWEVKACNMGLKVCTQPFIVSMQDDMVLDIKDWDKRLMKPMLKWSDVFAVTALASVDIGLSADGQHIVFQDISNDWNTPHDHFVIRDTINRGPLLLDHAVLEELGYMDEIYAPQGTDDIDLCYRAWKRGLVCGVYPMHAFFKIEDGTTRQNPNSDKVTSISWMKNEKILISRYLDIITGPKHTEVRILED